MLLTNSEFDMAILSEIDFCHCMKSLDHEGDHGVISPHVH